MGHPQIFWIGLEEGGVFVRLADVHLDHHEGLVELTGKGWLPVQEAVHLLTPTAPLAPHQQQYLLVLLLRFGGGGQQILGGIPCLVITLAVIGQAPGPEVVARAGGAVEQQGAQHQGQ
ncbi:hypothetical protein D3C77_568200 [compost metagenome]